MRLAALTLISSLALAAVPASANAAPAIPHSPAPVAVTLVSGGCGPGLHPDYYGYCVPNQYGYGGGYGGGWYGPHYGWGGYYHPHWHHWHY